MKRKQANDSGDDSGDLDTKPDVEPNGNESKRARLQAAPGLPVTVNQDGHSFEANENAVQKHAGHALRPIPHIEQRADEDGAPLMSRGTTHSGDEEAVVYSQTRMLQDPTGRLLYIGDAGSLSYLQLIRMVVENVSGPSPFTTDPRRHKIVESGLSLPPSYRPTHLLPDKTTAAILADAFFVNTQGLAMVFDREAFFQELDMCYDNPLATGPHWLCLLNLVFAIGLMLATPRRGTNEYVVIETLRNEPYDRTEVFYQNAKSLNDPMNGFEDADFWSIQALLLMSIYVLTKSKRNAAFALLGTFSVPLRSHLPNLLPRHGCTLCLCPRATSRGDYGHL